MSRALVPLDRFCLFCLHCEESTALAELKRDFCGNVLDDTPPNPTHKQTVYFAGDLAGLQSLHLEYPVRAIRELCQPQTELPLTTVALCQVPRNVHGVGILWPKIFADGYFERVEKAHDWQELVESDKAKVHGKMALRTGTYITSVCDGRFHLLRCSTNFTGPTQNVALVDAELLASTNRLVREAFGARELNHVLAQIYRGSRDTETKRERKAKISAHSDKTEDMPSSKRHKTVIAFASFYQHAPSGVGSWASLRFRCKNHSLPPFDVVLPEGSLFVISLNANALYTHEVIPSPLNVDLAPTRMGYVMRTSDVLARHVDGQTYIQAAPDKLLPLVRPTAEDVAMLKALYVQENATSDVVLYPRPLLFSLNEGDYLAPQTRKNQETL